MKVTIVRTISADDSLIDADTGQPHSDEKQINEPIRLLPKATSAPPPETDGDVPLPYDRELPALRTVLSYPGIDSLKVNSVAHILEVDGDTARSLIERGSDYVLNWRQEQKRAERRAEFEERLAAWQEAEAERQASHRLWLFRNKVVDVDGWESASRDEIIVHVKHKVLSEEDNLNRMLREIELLEQCDKTPAMREPIPRDVQIFVWRRDGGKCVQCSSTERLEFDHIIPLALGGSNTERNIQLLCESCNRQKGATV